MTGPGQGVDSQEPDDGCGDVSGDLSGGEESLGAAEGSEREPAPVLETVEHALDDVAGFVEFGVVFELHCAVLAWRDAGGGPHVGKPIA